MLNDVCKIGLTVIVFTSVYITTHCPAYLPCNDLAVVVTMRIAKFIWLKHVLALLVIKRGKKRDCLLGERSA